MTLLPRLLFLFLCAANMVVGMPLVAAAEAPDQLQTLQAKIAQYQQQLTALSAEKTTLKSVISALTLKQQTLTTQIQLTQVKIASANRQIQTVTQSIGDKEKIIASNQAAIAKELRSVAQGEQVSLVAQLISAHSLRDAWQAADEAGQFNEALRNDIARLRTVRAALDQNREEIRATKATLTSLQADLTQQKRSVIANKAEQQELLAQTNNDEAKFQRLLRVAQAELASYSTFTQNAGGAKLLPNQTSCDSWGCYYSQRDTLWGNIPLNRTQFRLASDGCLVTAMAMVMTHYGYSDVTPVTINADPSNFATYYPAYLLYTIHVGGVSATRKSSLIDATLSTGHPVIVGIHAYGGTHYVVLTSGRRGNYLMRDPYIANGKDISFTAHYTIGSIFGVSKVIISG